MTSLRRAALMWMTALMIVVGLFGVVFAYWLDLRVANNSLDEQMRQIARIAGANLQSGVTDPDPTREDDLVVQVWNRQGNPILTSDDTLAIPRQSAPGFSDLQMAGDRWRNFVLVRPDRIVQVSQRHSIREWNAVLAAIEAGLPISVTIALGWLVVGLGLGRVLGHLGDLATDIGARGVGSKGPIPLNGVPAEVAPLVVAMNALIERLHRSLDQQRHFLSDAAHELRTPLTALRLQIENLAAERDAADFQRALPDLRRGALRASVLVDQLLRMARYDASPDVREREPVDLAALVLNCVADHIVVADSKRIDLGVVEAEPLRIVAAAADLRILFGNLIENAARYTPADGVVDVGVRRRGDTAVVEICDTGCGIREDLLSRVFDRFFRAAPAGVEGTGLGLAICRSIALRYGLTITLENRKGARGLIATVTGPALP